MGYNVNCKYFSDFFVCKHPERQHKGIILRVLGLKPLCVKTPPSIFEKCNYQEEYKRPERPTPQPPAKRM